MLDGLACTECQYQYHQSVSLSVSVLSGLSDAIAAFNASLRMAALRLHLFVLVANIMAVLICRPHISICWALASQRPAQFSAERWRG